MKNILYRYSFALLIIALAVQFSACTPPDDQNDEATTTDVVAAERIVQAYYVEQNIPGRLSLPRR